MWVAHRAALGPDGPARAALAHAESPHCVRHSRPLRAERHHSLQQSPSQSRCPASAQPAAFSAWQSSNAFNRRVSETSTPAVLHRPFVEHRAADAVLTADPASLRSGLLLGQCAARQIGFIKAIGDRWASQRGLLLRRLSPIHAQSHDLKGLERGHQRRSTRKLALALSTTGQAGSDNACASRPSGLQLSHRSACAGDPAEPRTR